MMHFITRVEAARERFHNGLTNVIPFQLERVNQVCPGIIRGNFDCVTGNSSSGKTTLAKKLYVFDAISYAIEHKLNYHCIYFALEESEHQFETTLMSYLLLNKYQERKNIYDFDHIGRSLSDSELDKVRSLASTFDEYKSYITVIDNIYNTFGLYKEVRELARSRGTFYLGSVKLTSEDLINKSKWNAYQPHDPEEFIQIVTDHISEMHYETGENNLADAMMNWSKKQRHNISKAFHYNCMNIQQQAADTEDLGHFKERKLKPALQGLGDNKRIGRLYLNLFGIFAPSRHDLSEYSGYKTSQFFRVFNVIKHRYGGVGVEWALFFDGKTGNIKTMPKISDINNLEKAYNLMSQLNEQDFGSKL